MPKPRVECVSECGLDSVQEGHCVRDAVEGQSSCPVIHIHSYCFFFLSFFFFLVRSLRDSVECQSSCPVIQIHSFCFFFFFFFFFLELATRGSLVPILL